MNAKLERQNLIREIIHQRRVATQGELRRRLHGRGIQVDQATLSRDIHELGLVKTADAEGYRYTQIEDATPGGAQKSLALIRRFVRSIEWSGSIIVVKTDAGAAHPVGESIDRMNLDELLGTVAGDNTLIAIAREGTSVRRLVAKLRQLLLEGD